MRQVAEVARRFEPAPPHATRPMIALVFEGLSEEDKQLPVHLLYGLEGSRLFEHVCEQPEYYPARAEAGLLRAHADGIARRIGPRAAVVEYGPGAPRTGIPLLEALDTPQAYVPVDADAVHLAAVARELRARFETLRVTPLCQEFRQFVALPPALARARRRVAFLPGTTFADFRPLEAVALLNSVRETLGLGGGLLVGIDLVKEPAVLERAYDDGAGAMAAFNRQVLVRLNRELDATFDPAAFRHRAVWNPEQQRIEMGLVSLRAQSPTVAGISVALAAGEEIHTRHDYKHTLDGFAQLARIAGWAAVERWIDAEHLYCLQYLEAAE